MAQVITSRHGRGHEFMAVNSAVSCPAAGNTVLLVLPVLGINRVFVQFSVATQALDAFIVSAKAHDSATAVTLASTGANYTSPKDPIIAASGDVTTTAAAGTGWLVIKTLGMHELTISASAAVNNAAVTIYASGQ